MYSGASSSALLQYEVSKWVDNASGARTEILLQGEELLRTFLGETGLNLTGKDAEGWPDPACNVLLLANNSNFMSYELFSAGSPSYRSYKGTKGTLDPRPILRDSVSSYARVHPSFRR